MKSTAVTEPLAMLTTFKLPGCDARDEIEEIRGEVEQECGVEFFFGVLIFAFRVKNRETKKKGQLHIISICTELRGS